MDSNWYVPIWLYKFKGFSSSNYGRITQIAVLFLLSTSFMLVGHNQIENLKFLLDFLSDFFFFFLTWCIINTLTCSLFGLIIFPELFL